MSSAGITTQQLCSEDIGQSRFLFVGLCMYLVSQSFTIPLFAFGPSWAIWPTLADLSAIIILLATFRNKTRVDSEIRTILHFLFTIIFFCTLSFVVLNLKLDLADLLARSSTFGVFQLYRLCQFLLVFWATGKISLDQVRIRTLYRIALCVLAFQCVGVILTYTELLPTSSLIAHLPATYDKTGPWYFYATHKGSWGVGTLGYNHSYVASQIILTCGIVISLMPKKGSIANSFLLVAVTAIVFITGSRAGLATVLILAFLVWVQRPVWFVTIAFAIIILGLFGILYAHQLGLENQAIVERQLTLLAPTSIENLSGRPTIWQDRLSYLLENPVSMLIGTGFGTAVDTGENAHMLYLHIVLETGVVGLAAFGVLCSTVLRLLWRHEGGQKPVFWLSIAFLFSGIVQEIFYPTPAFGHFIGLYLFAVSLALGKTRISLASRNT